MHYILHITIIMHKRIFNNLPNACDKVYIIMTIIEG